MATPLLGKWALVEPPPGDTTVVYGPHRFTTPTGSSTIGVESFTLSVQPAHQYLLKLTNGNPDGSSRASTIDVVLNGQTIITAAELGSAYSAVRVVQALATDTLRTTVAGNAGAFVDVSILEVTEPTFAVFGPQTYVRSQGSPETETFTFSLPAGAGAPFYLFIQNGRVDGTHRTNSATIVLNGVQVIAPADLKAEVGGFARQVTLAANNTIEATVKATPESEITVTIVATDVGAPVLTISAPANNLITSDASVAVTGTVTDATATTVTVNGAVASRSGINYSATASLSEGSNTILVNATDAAGNSVDSSRTVIRDSQAPVLTVTAPPDGLVTNNATITVSGTVSDATTTTVNVNGTPVPVTGGAFSTTVTIVEGSNFITVSATDQANNVTSVVRTVSLDTQTPAVTLDAPADDFITMHDTITVRGSVTDAHAVSISANGTVLPVVGGAFSGIVPLTEGSNTITLLATDVAGNTTTLVVNGTSDLTAPAISVTSPANAFTTSQDSITASGSVTDATAVTVTVNGAPVTLTGNSFSTSVALVPGPNTITIVATDAAGNSSTVARSGTRSVGSDPQLVEVLGIDASLNAPPPAAAVATNVSSGTRFLYEGPNAVQTGVTPGAILPMHVAVIRGWVHDRDGAPVGGVMVKVQGHAELGQTLTRANGVFDMAVNGFGPVTINYSKSGYLNVTRQFAVSPLDYTAAPDVAMTQLDTAVTEISFTQPIEVARATPQADADGARRETLLFQQGTTVKMVMPNGDSIPLTGPIHVRSTEYTVGPNGEKAMPADLPASSAYTYAIELSVDEAMAAGAAKVAFSKPVFAYNENFLNYPVGMDVPAGYYDPTLRAWVASPNGRVLQILSVSGGVATLDVSGTGSAAHPDTLAFLGITQDELEQLAQLYPAGQQLWRASIPHFTPWDLNPVRAALTALFRSPRVPATNPSSNSKNPAGNPGDGPPESTCVGGSSIDCQRQTLGEQIPIVGTPYSLYYSSAKVPGFRAANTITIPVTPQVYPITAENDTVVPDTISLELTVAGRKFVRAFTNAAGQQYRFEWDGLDAYGRPVLGRQPLSVRLRYGYLELVGTRTSGSIWFFGRQYPGIVTTFARVPRYYDTEWSEHVGPWDLRGIGLGGWSLGDHHVMDIATSTVEKGDGGVERGGPISGSIIRTVTGQVGVSANTGDDGPARLAAIVGGDHFEFGHDGAMYIAGGNRLRRIGTDGIIRTIGGTGPGPSSGDGGHVRFAVLSAARPQFLNDGSLIFFDFGNGTIRRVGPDSIIRRWAGGGTSAAEDTTALTTSLAGFQDMVSSPDGSVYYVVGNKVRQITPGGRVFTIAGTGTCDAGAPAEGIAREMNICPSQIGSGVDMLSLGPDGALYLLTQGVNADVRRISAEGRMTRYAFGGTGSLALNGSPALNANVGLVRAIRMGPDGTLYWNDPFNQVRAVTPAGIMMPVAGPNNTGGPLATDGALAITDYSSSAGHQMRIGPDGALYVGDAWRRIRRIGTPYPGLSPTDIVIASGDVSEAYVFTGEGQHRRTVDATTGVTMLSFGYDSTGRLLSVTDRDSLVTTIEHDASGNPTAIVAPFGQRTAFTVDADRMLSTAKAPATSAYAMTYGVNSALGLLATFVEPGTGTHAFVYDTLGKLLSNANEDGTQTLARVDSTNRYRVTRTDAAGVATTHHVIALLNGGVRQVTQNPGASRPDTTSFRTSGTIDRLSSDGTIVSDNKNPDPRFGGASSFSSNVIVTPGGAIPQTQIRRRRDVVLGVTGDPLTPQMLVDTVRMGPGGSPNTFVTRWDAPTRTLATVSGEGRRDTTFLDSLGRAIKVRPAGLASTAFTYDGAGRVTQVARAGRLVRYSYNLAGLVDTITDPLNRTSVFAYDSAGRPTVIERPDHQSLLLAYDGAGRLSGLTPPGKPQHLFGYTDGGLLASYTPPSAAGVSNPATTYAYDSAQRLTRVRRPSGDSIVFTYDAAGRPSSTTFADATISTTYSGLTGMPSTVSSTSDGGQTTTLGFSGQFLTSYTQAGGGVTGSLTYAYDNQLRLSQIGSGVSTSNLATFFYDRDDLLTSIQNSFGTLTLTRGAQTGLVTGTSFNGVTTAMTYDSLGNLASHSADRSATNLYSATFTRDSVDRIVTKVETVQGVATTWGFAYDSAGRLSAVTQNGTPTASYTYDANGNRLARVTPGGTETGTYDDQDRVVSYSGATYQHTASGELSRKIEGADSTEYHYDALGALKWVELPTGDRIDYVIDPLGRRVGRKLNGAFTHRFLYESDLRIAAELNNLGQITTRYVYGTQANVPEFMHRAGVVYRFITDYLGSVRLVVRTSDGVVMQRLHYDEFGRVTLNTSPGFQPFGYAGGLSDDLTGLLRFGARDYEPAAGRWTTKDPSGLKASTNTYNYSESDPIGLSDLTGLAPSGCTTPGANCPKRTTWFCNNAKLMTVADQMYRRSVAENREYGAYLYRNSDGTVRVGPIKAGEPFSGQVELGEPEPGGLTIGEIHTHPDLTYPSGSVVPGNEFFSGNDRQRVSKYKHYSVIITADKVLVMPWDNTFTYSVCRRK